MTVKDIIKRLEAIEPDKIVVIRDSKGWSNLDRIIETKCEVSLFIEELPVFSDN